MAKNDSIDSIEVKGVGVCALDQRVTAEVPEHDARRQRIGQKDAAIVERVTRVVGTRPTIEAKAAARADPAEQRLDEAAAIVEPDHDGVTTFGGVRFALGKPGKGRQLILDRVGIGDRHDVEG
jgi:hypothetical protein